MNRTNRQGMASALLSIRRPFIIVLHVAIFAAALLLAYLLRFETLIPSKYSKDLGLVLLLSVLLNSATFAYFHLFAGMWRYTTYADAIRILKAVTLGSLGLIVLTVVLGRSVPRSIHLLNWLLTFGLAIGVRLAVRGYREWLGGRAGQGERRTIVIGAGDAAEMLLRSLRTAGSPFAVVGLVDDDRRNRGAVLQGAKVLGRVDRLPALAREHQVSDALLAMPSAPIEERRRITQLCRDAGLVVRTVPPLRDLIEGRASVGELQHVAPEDLLRREKIEIDLDALRTEIAGEKVLVTGAAGSIGLELCLQIASFEPKELILFERAESSLYFAELELKRRYPDLCVHSIVGDICDQNRVAEVFQQWRPSIVYHAAAYKHVPLMEAHPLEGIRNNVFGTEIVARQARASGVTRFVLISTDKAVAPVGVMGMSKRVAEGVILSLQGNDTIFTAVRFGNVLGSDGSVLPLFRWQMVSQAPITVTHDEATRYFMLTSEAAQLVMQAGIMAQGGEVFFLDMGQPVNIKKMAEELVRLSGRQPGKDVEIKMTGLRPGERLTEALVRESEQLLETSHSQIARSVVRHFDPQRFVMELDALRLYVDQRNVQASVAQLTQIASLY